MQRNTDYSLAALNRKPKRRHCLQLALGAVCGPAGRTLCLWSEGCRFKSQRRQSDFIIGSMNKMVLALRFLCILTSYPSSLFGRTLLNTWVQF